MNIYEKKKEPVIPRTFAEAITEDLKEVQDEIITEAVNHLIPIRTNEVEDEPRYLIGGIELRQFLLKFRHKMVEMKAKGEEYTRLSDLHIGKVEELSYHNEPYYEIARQKYYDAYPEYFFS